MAIVTLTILEGRDEAHLARLHRALADVVVRELPAKPHQVRTIIRQVSAAEYAVGGTPVSGIDAGVAGDQTG